MSDDGGGWRGSHVAAAFMAGALAGAVVAYLTAPQSGQRTRRQLKDALRSLGQGVDDLPDMLCESWNRAAEAARAALDAARVDQDPGGHS